MSNVTVINGVNTIKSELSGKTVSQIKSMLEQALNIGSDSQARVNGELVDASYTLQSGDELEFVKPAGTKG